MSYHGGNFASIFNLSSDDGSLGFHDKWKDEEKWFSTLLLIKY